MEPIHVRFEIDEAVDSKREILETQINLINISKKVKNYRRTRRAELSTKEKLRKATKNLGLDIKELIKVLPQIMSTAKEKQIVKVQIEKSVIKDNMESDLEEIKDKLDLLNVLYK